MHTFSKRLTQDFSTSTESESQKGRVGFKCRTYEDFFLLEGVPLPPGVGKADVATSSATLSRTNFPIGGELGVGAGVDAA